jgi:hypothetical protein
LLASARKCSRESSRLSARRRAATRRISAGSLAYQHVCRSITASMSFESSGWIERATWYACEPHGVLQRKPATISVHRSVERDPRLSGSKPRHRAMRNHNVERPASGRVVPRFDGSAARPRCRRHRHFPFPRQRCSMDPRGKKRGPRDDRARRAPTPTHPFHPVLCLALFGAYSGQRATPR